MSNHSHQAAREQSQLICENGLRLLQQGNLEEADKLFLEAHSLDTENIDALNLLGIRSYQKHELQKALDYLNTANHLTPNSAQTLSNLGLVHYALNDFQSALECFDLAIASNPNIPEAHNNRGNTLKGLSRNEEAIGAYQAALTLRPNYGEAICNQGVILLEDGNPEKAIALFRRAIEANPNLATAFNNLGNALTQLELYQEAFQCFERALQINNGYLDAYLNFGNSLKKAKQISSAIDCYQHALKINPEHAKTFYLLGEIYYDIGASDLAKTYYAKSLELNPLNIEAQYALAISQIPKVYKSEQELVDSRKSFFSQLEHLKACNYLSNTIAEVKNTFGRHPFYLAYQDENNEPFLSQYGMLCLDQAKLIQEQIKEIRQNPKPSTKVRIGIVSSFFCNHPVWYAITKGWINHLNTKKFEIHLFNTGCLEDAETAVAKTKSDHYLNCTNSIKRAAEIIVNQNVDVLLYPEIGMDTTSKALACLRLAPVQAASWGHPETTGLPTIDFYLSAQLLEPNNADNFYSEKLIQLPNLGTYFENEPVQSIAPNLEALGIDASLPIMLCAGSPSKYTPNNDVIFVEIAKRLGQCQFIFFNFDENLSSILRDRLQLVFAKARLDAKQSLRFIPFLKKEEFYGLMQKADLYLDTIGFSGFNTAMQALTCDLPVITIEGARMRGRLASGILSQIGLQDLICHTSSAYIDLAVKLIQNPAQLSSYRDKISHSKALLFNDLAPIMSLEIFLIQQIQKTRTPK